MKKTTKLLLIKNTPVVYYSDDDYIDIMFYGDGGVVSFYAVGSDTFSKKTIGEYTKLRDLIDMAIDDMTSHNHNSATKKGDKV